MGEVLRKPLVVDALVTAYYDFWKETTGSLRYRERGEIEFAAMPDIYIKKAHLNGRAPRVVKVVVTQCGDDQVEVRHWPAIDPTTGKPATRARDRNSVVSDRT